MAEATGGFIPLTKGGPTLERVPVDPGYVVIPASAVRNYGRDALLALNQAPQASC